MNMLEGRESCGSSSSIRFVRSAVVALVLAASAVGCRGGENLQWNRVDAAVEVRPDSGMERFIRCVRKAVDKSMLKDREKGEDGWKFRDCYRYEE